MNKSLVLIMFIFLSCSAFAGNKGKLGFSGAVKAEGIFKPEISEFKVEEVLEDSPAHAAGLLAGQLIVEIDGCKIPGCPAKKAKSIMEIEVGEKLLLLVKNEDGSLTELEIEAN